MLWCLLGVPALLLAAAPAPREERGQPAAPAPRGGREQRTVPKPPAPAAPGPREERELPALPKLPPPEVVQARAFEKGGVVNLRIYIPVPSPE